MTTKPFVIPEKVIDINSITAAKHEREFCDLQKMLPTYGWGQLKLRPLSVTLLKEFTGHQLCNLRTKIMSSLFSYLYFNAKCCVEKHWLKCRRLHLEYSQYSQFFMENKFAEQIWRLFLKMQAFFSPPKSLWLLTIKAQAAQKRLQPVWISSKDEWRPPDRTPSSA